MVPATGDVHKNFHSPLVGIRSRTDSSACWNAIKISHPRKQRFCNYFGSRSQRAEMHIEIYIPPCGNMIQNRQFCLRSRKYDPEPTIPLAEMQSKYCIPASGDFVIIFCLRSPRAEMHIKFTFPPRGNTIQSRQFRLRKCNQNIESQQAEVCYYFSSRPRLRKCTENCASPQAKMWSGCCISASQKCKRVSATV